MTKRTAWFNALRLRTLPLSISGILVGAALAKSDGAWNGYIFWGCLSTTLLFQIISNLANDLGDTQKGTDNENRVGPVRSVQSGLISKKEMGGAILLCSILALISAGILIYISAQTLTFYTIMIYISLTILSILAALTYTIGKNAYGYRGLGDLMVFIFFGGVAVIGSNGLFGTGFNPLTILGSLTIGTWSIGVLNLNNMRDQVNDKASNKITMAVKLGFQGARIYHFTIVIVGLIAWCILLYLLYMKDNSSVYLYAVIPCLLVIKHLIRVHKTREPKDFDPELKKLALSTFFTALLLLILSQLT
jgi:1,4-dihydroxy-2-naphthoate octaprenyltransferase